MKLFTRITAVLFIMLFQYMNAIAQQTVEKIITETKYLLYLPQHYREDSTKKWPLLMFLHGSGESGNDIEKVKLHGPPQLAGQGKQFPFIVVSPQSEVPNGWDVDQLYKLLQKVKKDYRVDGDRVYLTGLSMGGFGTWKMAMKYPEEFAAIAPVCGGGDTAEAWKIRNIPVWCFHGALDNVVPLTGSENMVRAASRYNSNVRFTVYPDKNHNSWDTTYNSSDALYDWFLKQKKFRYSEAHLPASELKKYEGKFIGQNDTVRIYVNSKGNGLIAIPGRDTVPLTPAAPALFYLDPSRNMDIRYTTSGGKVDGFLFMGDRKLYYRKIGK
jgi:predicted esterase